MLNRGKSNERAVRGIVVAVAMESIAMHGHSDRVGIVQRVGEFRLLLALKDDGTAIDVPATDCQFGPDVASGLALKGPL